MKGKRRAEAESKAEWHFVAFRYRNIEDELSVAIHPDILRSGLISIRYVFASHFGSDLIIIQPSRLDLSDLNKKLSSKIKNHEEVVVLFHSRHFDVINQWLYENFRVGMSISEGSLENKLLKNNLNIPALVQEIRGSASRDIDPQNILIEQLYEGRLSMNSPSAALLEQFVWLTPEARRLFFYIALYMTKYSDQPEGIYPYLVKHINDGVATELKMIPPMYFDDVHHGLLKRENGVFDRVITLIQQDYGNPPEYFFESCEHFFHSNPQIRKVFINEVLSLLYDRLNNRGLNVLDRSQELLGNDGNDRIITMNNSPSKPNQAWHIVVVITAEPGSFNTLSLGFSWLDLEKRMGRIPQDVKGYTLVIAPTFDTRAIRSAISLGGGIPLLDATAIWQLQFLLADPKQAQIVAERFPEFLGEQYGLIGVNEGLQNLGLR